MSASLCRHSDPVYTLLVIANRRWPGAATLFFTILSVAYLVAGGIVAFAYSSARSYNGYIVNWKSLSLHALWLLPGALLLLCTLFLRSHRWPIWVAVPLLIAPLPHVAINFTIYFTLYRLSHYHLTPSAIVQLPLWGGSLLLLLTGLLLLWRQWHIPLHSTLHPGGFDIVAAPQPAPRLPEIRP